MGQGQEIHARKLVGQFMQTVCIQLAKDTIKALTRGYSQASFFG